MVTSVNSSTFLSQYNDDYRDSDNFHRILFNSGRDLQARELTQMQTIIQKELGRIASFMFKEGSLFNTSYGALNSGSGALEYVKVQSLPAAYNLLVGNEITNADGVSARVVAVAEAGGTELQTYEGLTITDPAVLLINYTAGGGAGVRSAFPASSPRKFKINEVLTYDTGEISGSLTAQATSTAANPVVGKASYVQIPKFDTFVAGHLVQVAAQSLIVRKFNAQPTEVVGFKLEESIITSADDIALFDNSGATPNLTSPGADRYRIRMTLATESSLSGTESFYPVYKLVKGQPQAIVLRDNALNEMGKILNGRGNDTTGNFIVADTRPNRKFRLKVLEDSDVDYLRYIVDPGRAFVQGQRVHVPQETIHRVRKPRRDPEDVATYTNEFVNVRYGNYYVANEDSAFGMLDAITDYTTINLRTAVDYGGSTIGTARIRNVDKVGDVFNFHMFDFKMDSVAGEPYSTGLVRSFGQSASEFANITPINVDRYDLTDREQNSLLFPMSREYVKEVSSVTMPVRFIATETSHASNNTVTFTTGSASEPFTDFENMVLQNNSDFSLVSPISYSGTPGEEIVITNVDNSTSYTLLGYKSISAQRKTKTLTTTKHRQALANRQFKLPHADIYDIVEIADEGSDSADIKDSFIIDNGQRDNFYTIGSGKLRAGDEAPAGNVNVTYRYFAHGTGDFFAGKASYPSVVYDDVPSHTTVNDITYRLTDVIDMRPLKNTSGSGFTGTGHANESIPKNGATITAGQTTYWKGRRDTISLNGAGYIDVINGKSSLEDVSAPLPPTGNMQLHTVELEPYTLDVSNTSIQTFDNKGYKMTDIQQLENRISNLEQAVTLNAAEIESLNTNIPDPNDATLPNRVKLGLTSDRFTTNLQSAVTEYDYRAKQRRETGQLLPHFTPRDTSVYYDSDQSQYTVRKGGTVWPKYTEEVMIDQSVASGPQPVNRFEVSKHVGSATLVPNEDYWTLRKKVKLPDGYGVAPGDHTNATG